MRTVTLNSTTIPAVHSCVLALYRWSYVHSARPRVLRRKSTERMKSEQTDSLWLVRVQAHVRSSPRKWAETLMSWMSDCTLNHKKGARNEPISFLCPEYRTALWTTSSVYTSYYSTSVSMSWMSDCTLNPTTRWVRHVSVRFYVLNIGLRFERRCKPEVKPKV